MKLLKKQSHLNVDYVLIMAASSISLWLFPMSVYPHVEMIFKRLEALFVLFYFIFHQAGACILLNLKKKLTNLFFRILNGLIPLSNIFSVLGRTRVPLPSHTKCKANSPGRVTEKEKDSTPPPSPVLLCSAG